MYLADLEIGFDAEKASYFASPNLEGIVFLMTFGKVTVETFCTFKLNRYALRVKIPVPGKASDHLPYTYVSHGCCACQSQLTLEITWLEYCALSPDRHIRVSEEGLLTSVNVTNGTTGLNATRDGSQQQGEKTALDQCLQEENQKKVFVFIRHRSVLYLSISLRFILRTPLQIALNARMMNGGVVRLKYSEYKPHGANHG
ncbi:hypothetical protein MJG53_014198 [Ovis ammon polii x Ovis aries]|uniref:Uncharacterized protein n=2 Tax=Ovis TaxID=9935 RepID=A0A835ZX98_SHEEP|nr:hypothetical protein JEQ12_007062 [Ovis aries]KAI4568580.1 hypothetical protein MJG53_014198 [Ovis ammon polii x Ovis aries]